MRDIHYLLGYNKLWLTESQHQNDPFEFEGYYKKEFIQEYSDEEYKRYSSSEEGKQDPISKESWEKGLPLNKNLIPWQEICGGLKYHGMYCFSLNPVSTLMWSHYASYHEGICIKFKPANKLLAAINTENSLGQKKTITLVKYKVQENEPQGPILICGKTTPCPKPIVVDNQVYEYYKKWHEDEIMEKSTQVGVLDLIGVDMMLSKAKAWKYEEEFRFILLGGDCKDEGDGLDIKKLMFPNTNTPLLEIDSVIFGYRTSPVVKEIIQNSFSHLNFSEVEKDIGSYNLKISPVS